MSVCSLTLYPYNKNPVTIELNEGQDKQRGIEQIIAQSTTACIFSDLTYHFELSLNSENTIETVQVYVNDVLEPSIYSGGKIYFPGRETSDRRIFLDCYGFVELSVLITLSDGTVHLFSSLYLPVMVHRGELNDSVKNMVDYVYKHQETLLLNGEPKAKNPTNLKECGYRNLSAQIVLAEEIAQLYERSYGYFKANRRFTIEKQSKIEHFDKLQYITPSTVQFIVEHPEELRPINCTSGIRIGRRIYQPERTLSQQNACSFDTYENRVILGFLRKMISSMDELINQCDELLKKIPNNEEFSSEYIFSSYFMFSETKMILEKGKVTLSQLKQRFADLWNVYSDIMKIQPEAMTSEPLPSHIFLSVPQYNQIFVQIHKWFSYGIYDFSKECFMLSFIKISTLYEVYLLAKFIAYFGEHNYEVQDVYRCAYPVKRNWLYQNTKGNNTYVFRNEFEKITLYYQPLIYNSDESAVNGIGLMRNNSIPLNSDNKNEVGAQYYSPDYILKVETNEMTKYLILDAKFSNRRTVRLYHVKDLAFKYLFSVSPVKKDSKLVGMCLVYGKCLETDKLESAYDKKLPNQIILPIAEMLPLNEGINNQKHTTRLNKILSYVAGTV